MTSTERVKRLWENKVRTTIYFKPDDYKKIYSAFKKSDAKSFNEYVNDVLIKEAK